MNQRIFKRILKNRSSFAGLIIISFFILLALAAPLIAPPSERDPYLIPQSGYTSNPVQPSAGHIFGTTEQQYDLFYGIVWGTRTAFKVGIAIVFLSLLIGITLGGLAGYFGKWADGILMRFTGVMLAFPGMALAIIIVSMLRPGLEKMMLAVALVSWPAYARLVRKGVLNVKEKGFVTASRALGAGNIRILTRHVIPDSIYPATIVAGLDIGDMALTAASLSFLGLGAPPGYADWGQLVAMSKNWIIGNSGNPFAFWHTVIIPGGALFFFVLSWNLLGDAFRDVLDLKGSGK